MTDHAQVVAWLRSHMERYVETYGVEVDTLQLPEDPEVWAAALSLGFSLHPDGTWRRDPR